MLRLLATATQHRAPIALAVFRDVISNIGSVQVPLTATPRTNYFPSATADFQPLETLLWQSFKAVGKNAALRNWFSTDVATTTALRSLIGADAALPQSLRTDDWRTHAESETQQALQTSRDIRQAEAAT